MSRPQKTKEPKPTTVWVVECTLYSYILYIKQYTFIEQRPKGVKVSIRGFPRYVPKASGRHFFTDKSKMLEFVLKQIREHRETCQRRILELTGLIDDPDKLTIDTTPDHQRNSIPTKPGYLDD